MQNSTNMSPTDNMPQGAFTEASLNKHGLQQTKSPAADALNDYFQKGLIPPSVPPGYIAVYTGTTITRRMPDGGPSPYTAHYTPDGTMRITGDFKEGFKDVVGIYKEAGLKATNITGIPLNASDAYEVIKAGTDAGVTPVLADKGVLGTGKLFAEEGAKQSPDTNQADTQKYFNQVAENKELRGRLIDEMVKDELREKAELDKMTNQELANKASESAMSKATAEAAAEATAEAAAEVTAEAKLEPKPKQESGSENDTLSTATSEGGARMQEGLANADKLEAQGLQYAQSADGKSGVLTPNLKAGETDPSYSAHFTFDENGGVTATISGSNFDQGVKDVLKQFKEAGIDTVELKGPNFETSEGAYKAISAASDAGIIATLADKGVLESAKAFAEGAEQAHPGDTASNEAATKAYLENMAGNDELRQKMIKEMADSGLGTKAELDSKSPEELAEKAFDAMPKSVAEVKVEPAPETEPAPEPQPVETDLTELEQEIEPAPEPVPEVTPELEAEQKTEEFEQKTEEFEQKTEEFEQKTELGQKTEAEQTSTEAEQPTEAEQTSTEADQPTEAKEPGTEAEQTSTEAEQPTEDMTGGAEDIYQTSTIFAGRIASLEKHTTCN
jgi:hypothetical protein